MRHLKNKGLTLIEMLIASTISTIVMGIIVAIYMAGNDLWEVKSYQADLQGKARLAMEQMVNELKRTTRTSGENPSPNLDIPSAPNNKEINFYLPTDNNGDGLLTDANGDIEWDTNNQIKYQYIPGQKELRRLEKGNFTVFARDVEDIQFIDTGIDSGLYNTELKIILTLSKTTPRQRTMTTNLTALVKLRN